MKHLFLKNEFNSERFGAYIRRRRKLKGLTLVELGKLSELSQSYLSQIESGKKNEAPSLFTLKKIARYLEIDENELLQLAGLNDEIIYNLETKIDAILEFNEILERKLNLTGFLRDETFPNKLISFIEKELFDGVFYMVDAQSVAKNNYVLDLIDSYIKTNTADLNQSPNIDYLKKVLAINTDAPITYFETPAIDLIQLPSIYEMRYELISAYLKCIIRKMGDSTVGVIFLEALKGFFIDYCFSETLAEEKKINLDDTSTAGIVTYKNRTLTEIEKKKINSMLEILLQ